MAIKNIIFDFGGVLIDWNPRYFYKDVFSDIHEMEYFLTKVWSPEWNMKHDAGLSFSEITRELQELHPKYRNEIEMYQYNWELMIKGEISENTVLLNPLKSKYRLFGFYTGMIISEPIEAYLCRVDATNEEVEHSNKLFASSIRNALDTDNILRNTLDAYVGDDNDVIQFNRQRIYEKKCS